MGSAESSTEDKYENIIFICRKINLCLVSVS